MASFLVPASSSKCLLLDIVEFWYNSKNSHHQAKWLALVVHYYVQIKFTAGVLYDFNFFVDELLRVEVLALSFLNRLVHALTVTLVD